jgi:uncharacterized membrane protein YkvA (DUF1232 family)
MEQWKQRGRQLKREAYVVYLACRDPRTPWYAKLLAVAILAYVFSPIDLIPDFVPLLGSLDDLVLVPLGVALLLRLIPPAVLADCRLRAEALAERGRPMRLVGAAVIVGLWLAAVVAVAVIAARLSGG